VLAVILGYPLIRLVVLSGENYGLRALFTGQAPWVGFANYRAIFTDTDFAPVLLRTVIFCAVLVTGTMVIGLGVALMMNALGRRMRTAVTLCLIAAWAMPSVAATLIWQWLFQPFYGVVNWLLTQVHVFGDYRQHDWLSQSTSALGVVWLLVVWQSVPFVALTLYAALSQIPKSYYEAAQTDGATFWQAFRIITIPFLRPILLLVIILSVIWDFNVFTQIWILTQGRNGTSTMGIWSVTKAFSSQAYGQGAAIAIVSVALLMTLTIIYIRRLVRSGEEM
jgi:N,N'-diacetylchitobiose transport system permease protein